MAGSPARRWQSESSPSVHSPSSSRRVKTGSFVYRRRRTIEQGSRSSIEIGNRRSRGLVMRRGLHHRAHGRAYENPQCSGDGCRGSDGQGSRGAPRHERLGRHPAIRPHGVRRGVPTQERRRARGQAPKDGLTWLAPPRAARPRRMAPRAPAEPVGPAPDHGHPDWVCEVISPSNAAQDRVRKRRVYATHRVPFYWIIDPAARLLEALRLVPRATPSGTRSACTTTPRSRASRRSTRSSCPSAASFLPRRGRSDGDESRSS
jgi:hypothetical protein